MNIMTLIKTVVLVDNCAIPPFQRMGARRNSSENLRRIRSSVRVSRVDYSNLESKIESLKIGLRDQDVFNQWCRSLLSIGGIICNFTPILPYFQHWGGWTPTTILFRSGNLVKTKKISKRNTFSPNSVEDQKKKVFIKNRTLFSPNLRSDVLPFKLLGGCRCGPFSNYWGGYSQIIGEIYSPSPPPFGTPVFNTSTNIWTSQNRNLAATLRCALYLF